MNAVTRWFRRQVSNPQVVTLVLAIFSVSIILFLFGNMLAPVLAAVVIAYLLQGLVARLQKHGMPHMMAVLLVFVLFVATAVLLTVGLLPLLIRQTTQLVQQIPQIVARVRTLLEELAQDYAEFFPEDTLATFTQNLGEQLIGGGQTLLTYSFSTLTTLITIGVYFILVPLLVFFMVRDKDRIIDWFTSFFPPERQLTDTVWKEVDGQIGNYVRGKFWEIVIVGSVSFAVFTFLGLDYAALLAVITGFSVLIPYVGAAVVTIPVALVALFQWGVSGEFYWAVIAYLIIQALDGNLLAPLLFSEAVNLHPVAIIAAILFFGGIWGFWGVFFAIPLATVINAIIRAWPKARPTEGTPVVQGQTS
ncbi:MAG: AI-2E family transporter [Pseudomonadota bacterium]